MFVCRFGNPVGFGYAPRRVKRALNANVAVRRRLQKWLPGVVWPPVRTQLVSGVRSSGIRRRAAATTRRLLLCELCVGAAVVEGFAETRTTTTYVLCQGDGEDRMLPVQGSTGSRNRVKGTSEATPGERLGTRAVRLKRRQPRVNGSVLVQYDLNGHVGRKKFFLVGI